jgi:dolichol kinase
MLTTHHGARLGFTLLAVLALVLESFRLTRPEGVAARLIRKVAAPLMRPGEARRPTGATMLACGYALAWWVNPGADAVRAVLVGALADPAAAAGGLLARGRGKKTWFGSLTCFVVAVSILGISGAAIGTALAAGVAATLAERSPWPGADNLAVPLVTALSLRALP